MARKAVKSVDGPIYMLGHLVHNEHMTEELEKLGIELIDSDDRIAGLKQIEDGTVLYTAHGVSPEVRDLVTAKNLKAIDTTCRDVQVTHDLINELVVDGFDVLYVGRRGHPEAAGCIGEAPERVHLVETPADVLDLEIENPKLAITTQTTLGIWDTAAVIRAARRRWPDIRVHNDICRATQDRQEAVVEAARTVDVVIVVGSKRSSNSNRLVEVVKQRVGKPAYLVGTAAEMRDEWFSGTRRVAVTAGASTPSPLSREVIRLLERFRPDSHKLKDLLN
jgi:4-hydroxy-3-methylbut-2-enyl diphosphate reductase